MFRKSITALFRMIVVSVLLAGNLFSLQSRQFSPGPGDVLKIALYYPENMELLETVSSDYTISFMYLGSFSIRNMSIEQIQQTITKKLSDGFFRYPVVTVSVEQVKSKRVFIFGEVVSPGAYPWSADLTVLSAVALAGGFTRYSPDRIQLLRPTADKSKYEQIKVSIASLLSGNPSNDITISPDDVILISDKAF